MKYTLVPVKVPRVLTQKEKQKAVAKRNRDASSTPWGWLNCPICLEGTLGRYRLCLESVNSPPSWSHHWQSVILLLLVNHFSVPPQTGHCAWCSILTGQNWSEMPNVWATLQFSCQEPGWVREEPTRFRGGRLHGPRPKARISEGVAYSIFLSSSGAGCIIVPQCLRTAVTTP